MKHARLIICLAFVLVAALLLAPSAIAQQAGPIAQDKIAEVQAKLNEAGQSASSARKKLAYRRVIRQAQALIDAQPDAPNRYVVLGHLFKAQQQMVQLEGSKENRAALLETCQRLASAPNEYAAVRLDADLLLSQIEIAKQSVGLKERGQALLPLVDRYEGTEVEARVIKIALVMAIEFGNADVIGKLRGVIAERCPGNHEMINFQRDRLGGQVFGAPFVGRFESSDGKPYLFPMDAMGKTTALYFWTKEGDGIEQLKAMAAAWDVVAGEPDRNTPLRYRFISFNLDNLPDAGESILREAGLDWPALHLPGGTEHPIYKTYARNTPKLLTMTPTGYTAMVMSGSTRVVPGGWERAFGSSLARAWTKEDYTLQTRSMLIGEFTVIDPQGEFDPAAPAEWKAVHNASNAPAKKLTRTAASVPEATLRAIQECFVAPPRRYELAYEQLLANYRKADKLCQQAIAAHAQADDLWIVRNRRIIALMGLWKIEGKPEHLEVAAKEAQAALDTGCPEGTDVIARFCLARVAMRAKGVDRHEVIERFAQANGEGTKSATTAALASLLALDIADRRLHEKYRRQSLDQHANNPSLWTATAFMLDRYHRYWLYHPPFTAGWTYGRRMDYSFSIGDHEDAQRTVKTELKTLDGKLFRIPEDLDGKFTMLEFLNDASAAPRLRRYGAFVEQRPFDDVKTVYAVLDDNAGAMRQAVDAYNQEQIKKKRQPDTSTYVVVPGGWNHPIVRQLNVTAGQKHQSIVFLQPDGRIAAFKSGITEGRGGMMAQSVVECNDEKRVDDALARGDLEEAKRLAFAHAPVEQIKPEDAPKNWKPKKIGTVHLRCRAKVYFAMGELEAAAADAQEVYLAVKRKAGHISMRTKELEDIERLQAAINAERDRDGSAR